MGKRADNSTDRGNLKASCYCYCGCRFSLLKRELKQHFTKFGHSIAIARAKTGAGESKATKTTTTTRTEQNRTQNLSNKNISESSLIE